MMMMMTITMIIIMRMTTIIMIMIMTTMIVMLKIKDIKKVVFLYPEPQESSAFEKLETTTR